LYDKRAEAFPESLKIRLKVGTLEILRKEAKSRGFSGISDMTRAALKVALNNKEFKKEMK
jgi:hypothetical protein